MDKELERELEELLERPLWDAERFPDRDLSESEKWQIAYQAFDEYCGKKPLINWSIETWLWIERIIIFLTGMWTAFVIMSLYLAG